MANDIIGKLVDDIMDQVRARLMGNTAEPERASVVHTRVPRATAERAARRIDAGARRPTATYHANIRGTKHVALFPTASKVFTAIRAAGRDGLTQPDIERKTGLKQKTVESCCHYLRRHDADGEYVKSGRGLVVSKPIAE